MITLNAISMRHGVRVLFENVTLTFNPGSRYGLTGPNGAGKSTLLKIITKEIEPSGGSVTLPQKVGILKQNLEEFRHQTVLNCVIMGNRRLWDAFAERDRLYEDEISDAVGIRLGELEEIIGEEDGYSAESNAEVLLRDMGIPEAYWPKPMGEIPSDIQFKVLLLQALFGTPQALLLDEPTNHLDLESIAWLEEFLKNYRGTLIVVSHDRHFLNSVCTHIADIDYETVILYPGNYDVMVVTKSDVRGRAEDEAKSKEKKIAQLREFVSRFGAGTRASQVQSRLREIERLQPGEMKQSNIQRPYIRFIPTDRASGQVVFKVSGISKAYDHPVIKKLSFEVMRGDKIGIIGANGRGKTTLLKMLAGDLQPDSGTITLGHQAMLSYFAQNHHDTVAKDPKVTAFEWLRTRKDGVYDQEIRSVLGKLLFGGDDAFKSLAALSGGETARLIIAGMMLSTHNTLLLDEPNNHLDIEAVSALGWGLNEYKGTVLCASHDRDLIGAFATKILAFEEDGIHIFDGKLDDYFAHKARKKK